MITEYVEYLAHRVCYGLAVDDSSHLRVSESDKSDAITIDIDFYWCGVVL